MLNYLIIILAIAIFCYFSPYFQKIDPQQYTVNLPLRFEGPMAVNKILEKTERLFENEIHWPESLATHEGHIYSGLGDGRIVRMSDTGVQTVCRIGSDCEGQHEEHICGRPLGIRFDKKGNLFVVDAYHGLYTVDIKTGAKKQILSSSEIADGKPLTFLNTLVLDEEENVIYLTQSSTKWNISMVIVSILEHDVSGRLFKYDIKQKTLTLLKKDLAFPNGIEMSHDKKSILIAEGGTHKILRYFIRGPNKDHFEELPLILPGEPDNISHSKKGYWVALSSARTATSRNFYDGFASYPLLRKGFLQTHHLITFPIASILRLVPNKWAKETAFELLSGRILINVSPAHGVIIEFDDKGNILRSFHSPSGKIAHLSEVLEHNGYLYLGSWRNRYLGKLKV